MIALKSLTPEDHQSTKYYFKKEIIVCGIAFYRKVYFIKRGIVKISNITQNKERICFVLSSGHFFGANPIIDTFCFNYTCEAQYNITEIQEFDVTFFQKSKNTNSSPKHIHFIKIVQQHYVELERRIKTLSIRNAEQRLLRVLMEFKDKFDHQLDPNNQIVICMPLNQEELSNYIRITRETLNIILNKLKSNLIIEYESNTVTLTKKFFAYHHTF